MCVHLIKNTTLLSQECSGKLITWDRVYVGFLLLQHTTTTATTKRLHYQIYNHNLLCTLMEKNNNKNCEEKECEKFNKKYK